MKAFIRTLLVLFLLLSCSVAQAVTGYQIVKKQSEINQGFHDESSVGQMLITSQSGKKSQRKFKYILLEKSAEQGGKSMIKMISPADLNGVGLLSHQHLNKENDQWLYLPAMKKMRRISGGMKKGRFIASDFSYEDLSVKNIEDFTYKLLSTEPCGLKNCYVVESVPKDGGFVYSKTVSWISDKDHLVQRVDMYDKKLGLIKRSLFEDYILIRSKFWRPQSTVMKDLIKKRETRLQFSNIKVQTGLSASDFSKSALAR